VQGEEASGVFGMDCPFQCLGPTCGDRECGISFVPAGSPLAPWLSGDWLVSSAIFVPYQDASAEAAA